MGTLKNALKISDLYVRFGVLVLSDLMAYLAVTIQKPSQHICTNHKIVLECKVYAPINWPSEFVDEYLPLLKAFDYNKGSLNQAGINASASADIVGVTSC